MGKNISDNINSTQLKKNFVLNIISLIVTTILGFIIIPFIVKKVGVATYAYVPIASMFFDYMSVIIGSINSTISRFLTVSLSKDDIHEANKVYNSSFLIITLIEFIFLPILLLISFYPNTIVSIDSDLIYQIKWLFLFSFLGNLLMFYNGVFGAPLYSFNRIDLGRHRDIIRVVIRTSIIWLGLNLGYGIWVVGFATFLAAIGTFLFTLYYKNKLASYLILNKASISISLLRPIFKMIGWMIILQLGFLFFDKILLVIINNNLSSADAGLYSLINPIVSILIVGGTIVTVLFGPTITYLFSIKEEKRIINLINSLTKYLSLLVGLGGGLIILFSDQLLYLWLGKDYNNLPLLLIIGTVTTSFFITSRLYITTFQAYNKVKWPSINVLTIGILNIIIIHFLLSNQLIGILKLAIINMLSVITIHAIILPSYFKKLLNSKQFAYISQIRLLIIITIAFLLRVMFSNFDTNLIIKIFLGSIVMISVVVIQIKRSDIIFFKELIEKRKK